MNVSVSLSRREVQLQLVQRMYKLFSCYVKNKIKFYRILKVCIVFLSLKKSIKHIYIDIYIMM